MKYVIKQMWDIYGQNSNRVYMENLDAEFPYLPSTKHSHILLQQQWQRAHIFWDLHVIVTYQSDVS